LPVREAGRKPPPFPFIFFKPNTTVLDHDAPVVIPKIAQDDQADYEGELCIVIGKDAKNVAQEDALEYIAAFTAGNDISARKLQRDPALAGGVPQWGFSKGFDTFAPLGPALVRPDLVGPYKELVLKTIIDGETRQEELIGDMIFDCAYLISYLSSGTTLEKGSVIMTGTPSGKPRTPYGHSAKTRANAPSTGVGAGMKPPKWLVPGTRMDVVIDKIGTLRNTVLFEE
jgi:2-keto-4-pentenoate hydratase/2-oxohepta-3-ene-1,7-dioic acid hydratase in catechol pathway